MGAQECIGMKSTYKLEEVLGIEWSTVWKDIVNY